MTKQARMSLTDTVDSEPTPAVAANGAISKLQPIGTKGAKKPVPVISTMRWRSAKTKNDLHKCADQLGVTLQVLIEISLAKYLGDKGVVVVGLRTEEDEARKAQERGA